MPKSTYISTVVLEISSGILVNIGWLNLLISNVYVTGDETVHINEDLEDQFKQGLEHRMAGGFKGHLGLGFHDEEKKKEVEEKVEEKKESEGENKGDNCETDKPPESTKKEDSETSQESQKKHKMEESKEEEEGKDESVKKKMKMNFVKASSWCL